mmetsp:Transcript_33981/g.104895  ORF Transcript_33981/g.104895 Transcript_33981/m.104895 type:complete len:219 (-) Transcript_33981:404-1060(-)
MLLERCFAARVVGLSLLLQLALERLHPDSSDEHDAGTLFDRRTGHKENIFRHVFLDQIRFASDRRFIRFEVSTFEIQTVANDLHTSFEDQHVTDNELGARHSLFASVTTNRHAFDGLFALHFLKLFRFVVVLDRPNHRHDNNGDQNRDTFDPPSASFNFAGVWVRKEETEEDANNGRNGENLNHAITESINDHLKESDWLQLRQLVGSKNLTTTLDCG